VHFFGFEIGSGRRFFHQFEVLGVAKLTQPIVTGFEIQEQNVRFRQQGKTLLCFSESTFGVLIGVFTDAAFQGHFGGGEGGFDAGVNWGCEWEWDWGFNWLGSIAGGLSTSLVSSLSCSSIVNARQSARQSKTINLVN
jgi:hypothetical protein